MKPDELRIGMAVTYAPTVGGKRYRGFVRCEPFQVGGGLWVVHLEGMEADYGTDTGRPGRSHVHGAWVDELCAGSAEDSSLNNKDYMNDKVPDLANRIEAIEAALTVVARIEAQRTIDVDKPINTSRASERIAQRVAVVQAALDYAVACAVAESGLSADKDNLKHTRATLLDTARALLAVSDPGSEDHTGGGS